MEATMSSSAPEPRPGESHGSGNRFAIGVLIGAIAAIIGFLIAWSYLLLS
jgi:hypothetical protein